MVAKLEWTQSNVQQNIEQLQNPTMGVTINNESMLVVVVVVGGGLNTFYLYQIFALDSAVVEKQNVMLAWRLPNYCNVSSWRNNLIKLTYSDETKKKGSLLTESQC